MHLDIELEDVIMEAVINHLPKTSFEKEFNEKYINAEMDTELEADVNHILSLTEINAYKAGFRTALTLMSGKTEICLTGLFE